MKNTDSDFDAEIRRLISTFGKLDFLQQALEKQKVTRQLINKAKSKLQLQSFFYSLLSLGMILVGLLGFIDSMPQELTFIIPFGLVMYWSVRNHARKVKKALSELTKFAVGIHASKLAKQ